MLQAILCIYVMMVMWGESATVSGLNPWLDIINEGASNLPAKYITANTIFFFEKIFNCVYRFSELKEIQ